MTEHNKNMDVSYREFLTSKSTLSIKGLDSTSGEIQSRTAEAFDESVAPMAWISSCSHSNGGGLAERKTPETKIEYSSLTKTQKRNLRRRQTKAAFKTAAAQKIPLESEIGGKKRVFSHLSTPSPIPFGQKRELEEASKTTATQKMPLKSGGGGYKRGFSHFLTALPLPLKEKKKLGEACKTATTQKKPLESEEGERERVFSHLPTPSPIPSGQKELRGTGETAAIQKDPLESEEGKRERVFSHLSTPSPIPSGQKELRGAGETAAIQKTSSESEKAGRKRAFSHLSTPSPVPSGQKKMRQDSTPKSFSKHYKVIVTKERFPTEKLLQGDVNQINLDILKRFDKIPPGGFLPNISNHYLSKGALYITCSDKETENWLRNSFSGNNSTIPGATLMVLGMEEMPKPVKVAFKTKDVYTNEPRQILQRLQRINPNLHTEGWRVISLIAELNMKKWIFEIDVESLDSIKEAGYHAYTGLDRGTFRVLYDPRIQGKEET